MVDNNFNTSFNNYVSETELSDISILKAVDIAPRKNVSDKNYTRY